MEEGKITAETPVTIAGVTIIPIVRTSTNHWSHNGCFAFLGSKQPVSIIVASPETKKAFRINGEEVPLEQLIEEAPFIKEILESL